MNEIYNLLDLHVVYYRNGFFHRYLYNFIVFEEKFYEGLDYEDFIWNYGWSDYY